MTAWLLPAMHAQSMTSWLLICTAQSVNNWLIVAGDARSVNDWSIAAGYARSVSDWSIAAGYACSDDHDGIRARLSSWKHKSESGARLVPDSVRGREVWKVLLNELTSRRSVTDRAKGRNSWQLVAHAKLYSGLILVRCKGSLIALGFQKRRT